MVGIVVVAHLNIAKEMADTVELILGRQTQFSYVNIFPQDEVDKTKKLITDAIKATDTGEGVLVLTDMFGGTPSNLSLSFLEEGRVEVIAGFNLPMLIKLITYREKRPLNELARFITQYGQNNIYMATEILKMRKKETT
ncbi:MAG: PTS sugar transporter subunit IIA [Syntrophorhabdaceae bacterium]|nr:PTS sugar transporter subunit IIA [Syntrophorhabdaceae bacterium]